MPPPPPPAYGAPPAGGGGYSAVGAIQYGWARFTKSPSTLLVPALLVLVVVIVLEVLTQLILRATLLDTGDCTVTSTANGINLDDCGGPGFVTSLFATALAGLIVSIIVQLLGAGLIKCALNAVDGKEVNSGDVFGYATNANVITAAAIVSVATFVGTLLCYVPGLIVGFLTMFTMFYVVDKDMPAVDAVKASVSLTTSRLGDTVLFYVLGIICIVVGAILCLIGLLAAVPVVLAGAAYTFRMLNNEPVAPVA
jgi:uncharacterized membrane protein